MSIFPPQFIKSLKKAFEPVLTDVRIDWYLPENMEALLSPNEIPPLYTGNRLIGYCTLYDMTGFRSKKTEVYIIISFKVSLCISWCISNLSVLFYRLKDEAIKVCTEAPLVRFSANQMMRFHSLGLGTNACDVCRRNRPGGGTEGDLQRNLH